MMKALITNLFLLASVLNVLGHDISAVEFRIDHQSEHISVQVDLPWTLKEALEKFDPSIKIDKSRNHFDKVLFNYVKEHFVLWDADLNEIPLLYIEETVPSDQHVHGACFKFVFRSESISRIENRFLFDINKRQRNIHLIQENDKWVGYTTTSDRSSFNLTIKSSSQPNLLPLIVSFSFIGLFAFLLLK